MPSAGHSTEPGVNSSRREPVDARPSCTIALTIRAPESAVGHLEGRNGVKTRGAG